MVLQLLASHHTAICAQAQHAYPEECCGLMLGRTMIDPLEPTRVTRQVQELWVTTNQWTPDVAVATADVVQTRDASEATRDRRFWIDPQDLFQAQRYARAHQIDIIGVYHSHPNCPAVPSATDLAFAWSGYSYVIVAVHHGQAQDVQSWSLNDQQQFQSEPLVIKTESWPAPRSPDDTPRYASPSV